MAENLLLKYLKRTPRVRLEKLPENLASTGASAVVTATATTTEQPVEEPITVKKEKKDVAPPPAPLPKPILLKEKPTVTAATPPVQSDDNCIDFSSICGKFGWVAVGDDTLPVILRGEKQFVAVRIVESEIISKYTKVLPWHVFTSTNIKSYYVTEAEAKLLNEINDYHSDRRYGYAPFTVKDVVVTLLDAVRFHEYLDVCKYKLFPEKTVSGQERYRGKCGLLNIGGRVIAPYVRKKSVKYVPQIFLTDNMIVCARTVEMEDWDVAYLKFVCHVAALDTQKVKAGYLLHPANELIDYVTGGNAIVEDKAFSSGDYGTAANWLPTTGGNGSSKQQRAVTEATKAYWSTSQTVSERLQIARTTKNMEPPSPGRKNLFPPPPPLVRTRPNVTMATTTESMLGGLSITRQQQQQPHQNGYSTLQDTFLGYHSNGGKSRANGTASSSGTVIPPHHYPTPPQSSPSLQANTSVATATAMTNSLVERLGLLDHGLLSHSDLIDLCSPPPSPDSRKFMMNNYHAHHHAQAVAAAQGLAGNSGSSNGMTSGQLSLPHLLQHVEIDGKVIPATNLEPYKFHSTLVTYLPFVQKIFFPTTSLQSCQFVLKNVLGVKLHSSSGLLLMTLNNQGSALMVDSIIGVSDLQCYLPHLTYMFQQNKEAQTLFSSSQMSVTPKKARMDFTAAEN